VVDLLKQESGATIDELVITAGWLPHTTRAALTGLRKRGYAVEMNREDTDRGSLYRISEGTAVSQSSTGRRGWPIPDLGDTDRSPLETARASNGLMAKRHPSRGAGMGSPRMTLGSDSVASLGETISSLADLDANGLCLQWRDQMERRSVEDLESLGRGRQSRPFASRAYSFWAFTTAQAPIGSAASYLRPADAGGRNPPRSEELLAEAGWARQTRRLARRRLPFLR
jgi:hypothetical protein